MLYPKIITFEAQTIPIDKAIVLRTIGYPKAHRAAAPVEEALPRLIEVARDVAAPTALYGIYNIQSVSKDTVAIVNAPSFSGSRVACAMQGAGKALLFVLTLGKGIMEASADLAEKDIFEAFLLDAIASVMAEALANVFQDEMGKRLQDKGLWGGLRFSPGYCDWPVLENRALLLFIDSQKIHVSMTEGGLMVPEKTISGMIGYGPDRENVKINPCITCKRSDCNHRRDLAMP